MARDLSILIPARNEMWLARTIQDALEHMEADTEIIAVLDGYWADPVIQDHPRVTLIHHTESIGQRAATNEAARIAKGRYLMKADAHCAFDQGFDRKMLAAFAETGDDVTMVPAMRNLHAFDWVCEEGHRRYQGPSGPCTDCGKPTTMEVVWNPKPNPTSTAFTFDQDMHFQYDNEAKRRQVGDLPETMSIQGSCFMLTREKYEALDICSEEFHSWGQQGVEVACKTWLSGGRVLCNRRTWYAHMFRTQGGDFSFPYENPGRLVIENREKTKRLFRDDTWPLATKPFRWLIEKFNPPHWRASEANATVAAPDSPTKAIVWYSDNCLPIKFAKKCQRQLLKAAGDIPIISVTIKPMPHFGLNVHLPGERGVLQMFRQILAGLQVTDADVVFLCEHDVLYHAAHFAFTPPDPNTFYYDQANWRVRDDGFAVSYDHDSTSMLCAFREPLLREYLERVRRVEADGWHHGGYEPGTRPLARGGFSDSPSGRWRADAPSLDLRHGANLTASRWSPDGFRDKSTCQNWRETTLDQIEGWG